MANEEQLAILRSGVEKWNAWRRETLALSDLWGADLVGVNLRGANLRGANLRNVDLRLSSVVGANLNEADLSAADVSGADFSHAFLSFAILNSARVEQAIFSGTVFGWTTLGRIDLRQAKGLESVIHHGPSTICIDTVMESNGEIPEIFLRGAGVPDSFITYMRSLAILFLFH